MGLAWHSKAEHDIAIEYFEKALSSDLKTLGPDHPEVAIRWNNLGSAWNSKAEHDIAIEYFEKALDSDLKTLGLGHPQVATYWSNLGFAWGNKGETNKAIEYFEKALKLFEKAKLPHDIQIVEENIGLLKKRLE